MYDLCCERCVYAVWDEGDSSVGLPAGVEDCKHKFSKFYDEEYFEELEKGKLCPFYIPFGIIECEKTRCSKCNSSFTDVNHYHTKAYHGHYIEVMDVTCKDCGFVEEKGIYDIPALWM